MMKKYVKLVFAGMIATIISSCHGFVADPGTAEMCFLTGECLEDNDLSIHSAFQDPYIDGEYVRFGFSMDMSNTRSFRNNYGLSNMTIPSDQLYESFGDNNKTVQREFEHTLDELYSLTGSSRWNPNFKIATILYDGGISLIADKDFAGIPAGENLAPILTCSRIFKSGLSASDPVISTPFNCADEAGSVLGIPMEYICLTYGSSILFDIPMKEYEVVRGEYVHFELDVPVKVVLYLNWLNDRLEDPNAPVPYRDEVLHCSFTTSYVLR